MARYHNKQRATIIIRPDDFKNPEVFDGISILLAPALSSSPDELEITVEKCVATIDD